MKKALIILIILSFNLIFSHSSNYGYNILELSIRQTLGDINEDGDINILDTVLLIEMILNPQLPNECYIVPEVGPCDGICPTYYYNQSTNECEEFITGCCGVEVFSTLQECQNICE